MQKALKTRGIDLEISQDLNYQRWSWIVQRLGWAALSLLILGALLGLFGPGPLSSAQAGRFSDPIWAEYNRFWRLQSPMTLRLHFKPHTRGDRELRIWLNRAYLDAINVQHVTPHPLRVEAGADRVIYVFALTQPPQPSAVTFHLEPQTPGSVAGKAGLENGVTVEFRHFIYP